jgi:polyferredoxin
VDVLLDLWVHGFSTLMWWIDLWIVTRHHIKWSLKALLLFVLGIMLWYYYHQHIYFSLTGEHVYGFMDKLTELQTLGFYVVLTAVFVFIDWVAYRKIAVAITDRKEHAN